MKLPRMFEEKYKKLLGDEAPAFFAALTEESVQKGFRINPLRKGAEIFGQEADPIPWTHVGYYGEVDGKSPAYQSGALYSQEPSAMYPAEAAQVKPGDWVLDLCAAPGGKATQLAGALGSSGILVANEIHPKRAKILSENIERAGIQNALVTQHAPEELSERFLQAFDVVVVDAPCSGEGMFRKDAVAIAQWNVDLVEECEARQRHILSESLRMLKPGGRLVYSTCTFSPEENEKILAWLLASHDEMHMVPQTLVGGMQPARPEWADGNEAISQAVRFWPHHVKGEGHFVAVLEKSRDIPAIHAPIKKVIPTKLSPEQAALWEQFQADTFCETVPGIPYLIGDHLHLVPAQMPDFSHLNILRSGVHAGEFKKNRFEPNHALALAYSPQMYRDPIEMNFQQYRRYVQGLSLEIDEEYAGFKQVCIQNLPLGWVKAVQGTAKNFFPKGLRFQFPFY
ncbi:RsmB/NOP family class I SAM-dependent RNA methyltransferase [Allofustis seminis]|uniref:RsmB/NOP family class I SAM-dependent RNA methyltransferase n=1 Tax=Allofustis seminis TaxID=166939 RepID=UPI00038088A3|nr:RsmF rRNA methyltransferase first C-terminal domain-containing protein [Allofustis seminis]